jgi:hypothetical protein
MAPRRKPPQNIGELDFSRKLADALGQETELEPSEEVRRPINGEQVRVGTSETAWTILSISYSGKEVNLHIPGTALQRFRVMVTDLVYIENPLPPKPKEQEKTTIDVNSIREGIEEFQHSILDYLQVEVAALNKFVRSKGISIEDELDRFNEATVAAWRKAVERIEEKLQD